MSGTIRRAGHVDLDATLGLATVNAARQRAYTGETTLDYGTVIWYRIGARVGSYNGGTEYYRLGMMNTKTGLKPTGASGRVPNDLLEQTVEGSTSASYTGGGEGETKFLNLINPYPTTLRDFAFAVASRTNTLTIGMTPAANLGGAHNTGFYDRGIPSGETYIYNDPGEVSNQGHMAIWAEGETNVAPNTPGAITRSGTANRPTVRSTFSDANETLNNGVAYDKISKYRLRVIWGGVARWDNTYTASSAEKAGGYSQRQLQGVVPYDTTVTVQIWHYDLAGLVSPVREMTFSVPNPNNPPSAPTMTAPSGIQTNGDLTPVLTVKHYDIDGNRTSKVRTIVRRTSDNATMWDRTWTASIASGGSGSISYAGTALRFYTDYTVESMVWDSLGAPGPWGAKTAFEIYHVNRAPNVPKNPVGLGNRSGTQALSVSFDFSDPDYPKLADGTNYEGFYQKRVIVRRQSDNVVVWNPGVVNTTASEKSNLKSLTTWTLPAWDVTYIWEETHRDRRGAWATYAKIAVKAVSGAAVDQPSQPTGKQYTLASIPNIKAVYRSTAGFSANRINVGVFNNTGTLISQREVAKTVAPNGTIDTSFVEAWGGTGFAFEDGVSYQFAVSARDTAGNWSEWSPFQTIAMNARPDIPTLHSPVSGSVFSQVYHLRVNATDSDDAKSALTVTASISKDGGTAVEEVLPWDAAAGAHRKVPATMVSGGYGVYEWQVKASDGTLESEWSPVWTYVYAPVPDVTITAPTGPTVTTSQPVFEWTVADQQFWQLEGRNAAGDVVYDTGKQAGAVQTHTIQPDTNWAGDERWNNNEMFSWTVTVWDSTTLKGSSEELPLTVEYIPPAQLIVNAEAKSFSGAAGTHYVEIYHDQSAYVVEEFRAYIWSRVEIEGPAGAEKPGTLIANYARVTNSADTTFTDFDVTSNQWYRWSVRQEIQSGVDIIYSDPAYVEMQVAFFGTLIHMPFDPMNHHVYLRWSTGNGDYDPASEWIMAMDTVMPMNQSAPWDYLGAANYTKWEGSYGLFDDDGVTVEDRIAQLRKVWMSQNRRFSPDGRPHLVCWREGRGGPVGRVYGRITGVQPQHDGDRAYAISISFEERHYSLGIQEEGQ